MVFESLVAPLASFLGPSAPLPAPAPQFHGDAIVRTTLYGGTRWLNSNFEPADDQLVFGIDIDAREPAGRAGFEGGFFYSSADESTGVGAGSIDVESTVWEYWGGARWTFDPWFGHARPYVGTGFSALWATYETGGFGGSSEGSGWAFGLYGHAGLEWAFTSGWAVGFDVRALVSTDAGLQVDVPVDYTQAALTLSWTW